MRVKITPDVVVQGELVPPDWYPFEIARVVPTQTDKGKDSDVYWLKVIDGPFKGKEFRHQVVEGGIGYHLSFFGAIFNRVFKKDDKDMPDFDGAELVGKKAMLKTKRGEYNGKPQDQLEDFRPLVSK